MTITDFSEADIRTQKWMAQIAFALAVVLNIYSITELAKATSIQEVSLGLTALSASALMFYAYVGTDRKALRWELEEMEKRLNGEDN